MRYRRLSFYVEWTDRKDISGICHLLLNSGAWYLSVDEEMDQQYIPGQSFLHEHTVFQFRVSRSTPVHEMLSSVASHPGVYSAGELT